jgi:hypothetical protein
MDQLLTMQMLELGLLHHNISKSKITMIIQIIIQVKASDFTYAAKNPGTWANNLKVCFIDDLADQTIGITQPTLQMLEQLLVLVLRLH